MLQETKQMGSDRAPETLPDRTRILDPQEYWPNPLKCPDWPALRPGQVVNGIIGKRGAEMQLEALSHRFNPGGYKLRPPTDDDRAREISRLFRPSGADWHHLGIPNLSVGNRNVVQEANLIVEACHIRGYLRKLEVQEKESAESADRQRLAEARKKLDSYRANAPERIANIEALSEAAARHQQRLDDERAFYNLRGAKQSLDGFYSDAVRAAHELGLSVPDAPEILAKD